MHRPVAPALAGVVLALAALAAPARAEDAVVVLDRGSAAEAAAEDLGRTAVRLVTALSDRGGAVRFVVYGTRAGGRMRAGELRGEPAAALAEAAEREGWRFEGPTDPRVALELAVRQREAGVPLAVFLVGPFGGDDEAGESATAALEAWRTRAPEGSRVFAIGLRAERRSLLAGVPGLVEGGAVVLRADEAEAVAAPWSPLPLDAASGEPEPLLAEIRVPLECLDAGDGPGERPLLVAGPADPRTAVEPLPPAGEGAPVAFRLRRPAAAGRVETVSFRAPPDPGILWLAEPPPPRTLQWRDLRPDVRLVGPEGGPPPPFVAAPAQAGSPRTIRYRLLRTRVGPAPEWTARAAEGDLPAGLSVAFGPEVARDEEVLFRDVTVAFAATAGRPLEAEGTLLLAAPDREIRLPYRLRVPVGKVRVRLEAPPSPAPLPPSDEDPAWSLLVEPLDPNAPRVVRLTAATDPPEARDVLRLVLEAGGAVARWDLAAPQEVRTGVRYSVRPAASDDRATGPAAVLTVLLAPQPGVEGESEGHGRVRPRRPSIGVVPGPARYRLEGDGLVGDPPLRLRLDPDGGTGDYRLALLEVPPEASAPPGAPVAWDVRPEGPGEWVVVPSGGWQGEGRGIFDQRTVRAPLAVDWAAGGGPGALEVEVVIPARWGAAGWVLVALAACALALGLWGIWQLRAPRVGGTLLYTVEDRPGAVGRLDLSPVGRRPAVLRQDPTGRLHLGAGGTDVATLRPTRVGGLLAVPVPGGPPEEHLLVEGLVVVCGRHRLRYVPVHAGEATPPVVPPAPAEDLLGPEFDLRTGRIQSAGGAGDEPPPDAGRGGPRGPR